jgi:hypothetical protein
MEGLLTILITEMLTDTKHISVGISLNVTQEFWEQS